MTRVARRIHSRFIGLGSCGGRGRPSLTLRVCAVERSVNSSGCESHTWKEVVPQEAVGADREATNGREPSMSKGCLGSSASLRAIMRVNVEQAPKTFLVEADPPPERGRPRL